MDRKTSTKTTWTQNSQTIYGTTSNGSNVNQWDTTTKQKRKLTTAPVNNFSLYPVQNELLSLVTLYNVWKPWHYGFPSRRGRSISKGGFVAVPLLVLRLVCEPRWLHVDSWCLQSFWSFNPVNWKRPIHRSSVWRYWARALQVRVVMLWGKIKVSSYATWQFFCKHKCTSYFTLTWSEYSVNHELSAHYLQTLPVFLHHECFIVPNKLYLFKTFPSRPIILSREFENCE